MRVKKRYKQIAEMWNKGMTRKQIADELNISEKAVQRHLKEAEEQNISLRAKEMSEMPLKTYQSIAILWNEGLREEEIAEKLNKTISTVVYNLREARLRGITLIGFDDSKSKKKYKSNTEEDEVQVKREKSPEEMNSKERAEAVRKYEVTFDENTREYIEFNVQNIKASNLDIVTKIKRLLEFEHPSQVAKTLDVDVAVVMDVINHLETEEKENIVRQFVCSRRNIYKNMDRLIRLGRKPGEALTIIAKRLPMELLTELADVCFAIGEEKRATTLLKRLWLFDGVTPKIKSEVEMKLDELEKEKMVKSQIVKKNNNHEENRENK